MIYTQYILPKHPDHASHLFRNPISWNRLEWSGMIQKLRSQWAALERPLTDISSNADVFIVLFVFIVCIDVVFVLLPLLLFAFQLRNTILDGYWRISIIQ